MPNASFPLLTQSGQRDAFAERSLWNVRAFPASVRLDAGELDHLAPFLGFVRDQPSKVGGGHWHRHATEVGELRFLLGLARAALISSLSLLMISTGVLLGAPTPFQVLAS